MSRLDELQRVFGGDLRVLGDRRWLEASVSGLRTLVIERPHGALELAVATPDAADRDPFLARLDGAEWVLADDHEPPRLAHGFVFAGCRAGVLFATSEHIPPVEDIAAALWQLGRWARHSWCPLETAAAPAPPARSAARRWRWVLVGLLLVIWWLVRRADVETIAV